MKTIITFIVLIFLSITLSAQSSELYSINDSTFYILIKNDGYTEEMKIEEFNILKYYVLDYVKRNFKDYKSSFSVERINSIFIEDVYFYFKTKFNYIDIYNKRITCTLTVWDKSFTKIDIVKE